MAIVCDQVFIRENDGYTYERVVVDNMLSDAHFKNSRNPGLNNFLSTPQPPKFER